MVVVGIIAVLLGVAAYNITRSRRRIGLERAVSELEWRVSRAQSLAAVAGSRLGPPRTGTMRVVYGANCTNDPQGQLWVRYLGSNTFEIPEAVNYNAATDQITVSCEVYDVTGRTPNATVAAPAAPQTFAFAPSGRLLAPAGPVAPVFLQLADNTGDSKTFGFRILPSGIMCPASVATACDEETGP